MSQSYSPEYLVDKLYHIADLIQLMGDNRCERCGGEIHYRFLVSKLMSFDISDIQQLENVDGMLCCKCYTRLKSSSNERPDGIDPVWMGWYQSFERNKLKYYKESIETRQQKIERYRELIDKHQVLVDKSNDIKDINYRREMINRYNELIRKHEKAIRWLRFLIHENSD